MSDPDRLPHCGPETTATYWMSRVANHIQTIRDSPMVSYVSAYIASTSVADRFEDNIDPETGEPLDAEELIDLLMEAENKAFNEYAGILDRWCESDEGFKQAARLATMLADANYLSLSQIDQEGDEDLDYARECAYEYSKVIKQTVAMYNKTSRWAWREEGRDED